MLDQVALYLSVGANDFSDEFRRGTRFPDGRRRNEPLDIDHIGIEQQSHRALCVVCFRSDVRENDERLFESRCCGKSLS